MIHCLTSHWGIFYLLGLLPSFLIVSVWNNSLAKENENKSGIIMALTSWLVVLLAMVAILIKVTLVLDEFKPSLHVRRRKRATVLQRDFFVGKKYYRKTNGVNNF